MTSGPGSLLLYPINVAQMLDNDVCASDVVLTRRHYRHRSLTLIYLERLSLLYIYIYIYIYILL